MRSVDEVRGFDRNIRFSTMGGYPTSGGVPLTNCVVEVKEIDTQAKAPVLSLRFYHKPDCPHQLAEECAEAGRPPYDEDAQIGVAIDIGIEMAHSLMTQLQTKWPEFVHLITDLEEPPTEG